MMIQMIIINVTQDEINRGERNKCKSCPIALSIIRSVDYPHVYVGKNIVTFYTSHDFSRILPSKIVKLPKEIQNWIYAFDSKMPVMPISFELDV